MLLDGFAANRFKVVGRLVRSGVGSATAHVSKLMQNYADIAPHFQPCKSDLQSMQRVCTHAPQYDESTVC